MDTFPRFSTPDSQCPPSAKYCNCTFGMSLCGIMHWFTCIISCPGLTHSNALRIQQLGEFLHLNRLTVNKMLVYPICLSSFKSRANQENVHSQILHRLLWRQANFVPVILSTFVLIPKVTAETEHKHRGTNFTLHSAPVGKRSATMDRSCPFLLLVLSCYSVCVHSEELSLTPLELAPVPCNDKAVGKLSRLAMTYINEDRPDGYKFALNRVANVHLHAQVSTAAEQSAGNSCGR